MDSARAVDRLPWLDTPHAAPPSRPSKRGRVALLVLLALFLAGTIAVLAFLAGRGSAPVTAPAPVPSRNAAAQPPRSPPPAPVPIAAPPAPPAEVTAPPLPTAEPVRALPDEVPTTPFRPERRASPADDHATPSAAPRHASAVSDQTRASVSVTPARPGGWPARPFAGAPGRVIQLGAYATQAQADAEWWRAARAYPYLATLPRLVTPTSTMPGQPRLYGIRLAAPTAAEARALCRALHGMRRGCIIV